MRSAAPRGFTLIELMLAIALTLLVVGTYLRFFSHTARYEANNTLKTNITMKGEYILDSLENAIRIIGLGNTSPEFKSGTVIASANGAAVSVTDGGYLTDPIVFTFISPWGGPVTATNAPASGISPSCILTPANTNSFLPGTQSALLITKDQIYTALLNFNATTPPTLQTSSITYVRDGSTMNLAGVTCTEAFQAEGTIVTGLNKTYNLTVNNGFLTFQNQTDSKIIFSYPQAEIPFFTLQFLTESVSVDGGGNRTYVRTWTDTVTDCGAPFPTPPAPACSTIKAIRFGFVITAREAREGAGGANAFQYCFFEDGSGNDVCYSAAPNTGKRYAAFSRVVHIRNYDYLHQHLLMTE